jgi:hypothetical protein
MDTKITLRFDESVIEDAKKFADKHRPEQRFFNQKTKDHLFVLCGMDEPELVLADIVGQVVVHCAGHGKTEEQILEYFRKKWLHLQRCL